MSMFRFHKTSIVSALVIIHCLLPTAISFGQQMLPWNPNATGGKLPGCTYQDKSVDQDSGCSERRQMLKKIATAVLGFHVASLPLPSAAEGVSVLRSKGCYRGEGEACDDLAEGNEFIWSLQKKSAENREMNDREALSAYNMKNFPDFFASLNPPKYLVKQPDGTFGVYTDAELAELKKMGKIAIENPKTKGGKFMDLTQKPMLVLVE